MNTMAVYAPQFLAHLLPVDTVVVFDRIRENFRHIRRGTAEAIMNTSINQMLGRTIVTSLTTLIVLLALLLPLPLLALLPLVEKLN